MMYDEELEEKLGVPRVVKKRPKKSAKPTASGVSQVMEVMPSTPTQHEAVDSYLQDRNLVLHGVAGTGKTFLACYLAMLLVQNGDHGRLTIVRSAVPTRDLGFMPGNLEEKSAFFEDPYKAIFAELYGRGDAYDILKHKGTVEFLTTSFVRGITLRDTVVILDEAENCTLHECESIITRLGERTRIFVIGDAAQSDLKDRYERAGFAEFLEIVAHMPSFARHEFGIDDIMRSSVVKEYIIAKSKRREIREAPVPVRPA